MLPSDSLSILHRTRRSTIIALSSPSISQATVLPAASGEGADEVFGGYLYFHKAPDAKAFHEETVRKLGNL